MSQQLITILSVILAICATVAAYIFVMPKSKRAGLNKFLQWLHDFLNFKFLVLEKLLKLLYVLSSAFMIFAGFFLLFGVRINFGWGGSQYVATFQYGLMIMILGPIIARLIYEGIMLVVLILKNVTEMNAKLGGDAKLKVTAEKVEAPAAPAPEYKPNYKFCTECGTRYDANKGGCPNCKK